MKKIMLLAAIAVCSISSYAQVSFGGQVGANLAMGHATDDNTYPYAVAALANDPKPGFLIGVLAEIDFGKLGFRPELNFIQKGSKTGYGGSGYSPDKVTLNYIEIPLNVVYNLDLGPGKLFFGLGPAIGIGLSGKDKYTDTDGSHSVKIKFDGKKDATDDYVHYKRMDIGASVLAGYKLPMGVFAKLAFTYGFSNIDPYDNYKYKNRGVSLCVGYMLGGEDKKKK